MPHRKAAKARNAAETVIVTEASSGIGEITAQMFPAEGHRVFGTSRLTAQRVRDIQPVLA
jgi:NADP-dependent 3-hydroxy acid dehydrogenase YdfG